MKNPKRIALGIPLFSILFLLAFRPERYSQSVLFGLQLFVTAVLPSLFPFMFFSKLIGSLGLADDLSNFFEKPLARLYKCPPCAGYILVVSMLSGYPICAKLVAEAKLLGSITAKEAKRILAFSMTSGPIFVLGTVGVSFFQSKTVGLIILGAHYLSSFINGFLYCGGASVKKPPIKMTVPSSNLLSDAIQNTLSSVFLVGSFIALFNLGVDILQDIKVFEAVALLAKGLGLNQDIAVAFATGIVEMTRGCLLLSKLVLSPEIVAAATALISLGGLSVSLQAMSFLYNSEIPVAYFFKTKITHACLAGIIAYSIATVVMG